MDGEPYVCPYFDTQLLGLTEEYCRLVAQLINPTLVRAEEEDLQLVVGGHGQYCSFTWSDLWAIAPWMADKVTKRIEGAGLGLD
jgi:hypothetical protein